MLPCGSIRSASSNPYRVTIWRKKSLNRALAADHALPSRASSFLTAAFGSAKGAV